MTDDELASLSDRTLGQYFLVARGKLSLLIDAAGIRPHDRVLELGAGVGTIARCLPPCRSLTLVELDERLLDVLRANAPGATVIQGDALTLVQEMQFDVLIGSLPNEVTESLIAILAELSFRTAVLAVGEATDLASLTSQFEITEVTTMSADDFRPPQPSVSRLVKIARR